MLTPSMSAAPTEQDEIDGFFFSRQLVKNLTAIIEKNFIFQKLYNMF